MAGGMMGAVGAEMSASATARGDNYSAGQEEQKYYLGMVKSFQTDTAMTTHLTSTIANIEAVRAASGASLNSPSGAAIQNRVMGQGSQDISRETQHLDAMKQYQRAADDALQAGGIAAAGAIAGGIGKIGGMMG
jgi:hypothetical protein